MINLDFVPKEVVGFGLCGVVLDLTFVLVLSAAHDVVLSSGESTSVVLAASIFPLLALKMTAPLLMQHLSYHLRVAFATGSACWALCAIAVAPTLWTKLLLGVAVGAVSTGLAEVTFFALASRYSTSCLVALSTGTGLSGIAGSGLYFVFTQILHYSVKNTLIFTSVLPISLLLCYFLFLTPIPAPHQDIEAVQETDHQLPSAYDPLLGVRNTNKHTPKKNKPDVLITCKHRSNNTTNFCFSLFGVWTCPVVATDYWGRIDMDCCRKL